MAAALPLALMLLAGTSSARGTVLAFHRLAELIERTVGRVSARRGMRQGRQCGRCCCPASHHDHYRPGTDCGACGRRRCPRYRPARGPRPGRGAYPTALSTGHTR